MGYKSDIRKINRIEEAVDFPQTVLIDNCNACNLRCSMCDHKNMGRYRRIERMSWHLYTRIIDEISVENPDARVWMIFFGEPCLCRDMAKRIEYAKKRGLRDVVLNSNGVLMDESKIRAYIAAGLDAIYVGLDAAEESIYRRIRVGGDFNKAVENVLCYRDHLKTSGNGKQQIFVQFVVSETNEHEVEKFKAFWKAEGVHVKIRPKLSWAGLINADNLNSNEDVVRRPCHWLMNTINICSDGSVALCSVDVHCRVRCGQLAANSIRDIWHGPLKEYRRLQKENRDRKSVV